MSSSTRCSPWSASSGSRHRSTSSTWLLAGIGGLIVGTAAALAAKALRLGAFTTLALAVAAYALFGSALAVPGQALFGVLPTGTSLTSLAVGAVWGWADILTLSAPIDLPDYVTVVPYVAAWVVGLVGATLAARWLPTRPRTSWRAALLLVGPLALYLASVLLGTREPFLPGVRGVLFAAVALIWLGWRRGVADKVATGGAGGGGALLRRRIVGTATLVTAAIALGAVAGSALAAPPDRFVLRERIEPPYEPLDFASPLAGFREYSKLNEDETIFLVTGLEPGQRLRLATMDAYDGHLWTVAGAQVSTSGSGSFALVGPDIPLPPPAGDGGDRRNRCRRCAEHLDRGRRLRRRVDPGRRIRDRALAARGLARRPPGAALQRGDRRCRADERPARGRTSST